MATQVASKVYADFTGGLVTEANKLSYPDNAMSDMQNFDLNENGSVQRRPGLRFDNGAAVPLSPDIGLPIADTAVTSFRWKAVNGDPDLNIAVVQIADRLSFYYLEDNQITNRTASADYILEPTISPSESTNSPELRKRAQLQATSGGGKLYVAGPYIDPTVLTFKNPINPSVSEVGTVSAKRINVRIRDFSIVGNDDEDINAVVSITGKNKNVKFNVAGSKKQAYMSGKHAYNLANQGWPFEEGGVGDPTSIYGLSGNLPFLYDAAKYTPAEDELHPITSSVMLSDTVDSAPVDTDTAAHRTLIRQKRYPTIYEAFHAYQNGGGTTASAQVAFQTSLMDNDYTGTTPAGRGKLIKEAFHLERKALGLMELTSTNISEVFFPPTASPSGAMSIVGFPDIISSLRYEELLETGLRPESIAFYAGRIWYAGVSDGEFSNNVYFSQVINDDITRAGKCYQDADPTAEDINELVATDGGVFNIEEIGKIYRIHSVGPSLVIIADNGVWVISGDGEASSFTAISFSVRKVTDQGATSRDSIAFAKDSVFYWSTSGINAITADQTGFLAATDITSNKIKSLYLNTSRLSKTTAFSIYDEGVNRILWFFRDIDSSGYEDLVGKVYNKVLYFDMNLNAFGLYDLSITPETLPVAAINADILTTLSITDFVTTDGVVVSADGTAVTVTTEIVVPDRSSIKILTLVKDAGTWVYRFSDFSDFLGFKDWGNNYISYLETGFDSLGDVISEAKRAPVLVTHFLRTETGFDDNPDVQSSDELSYKNPSSCLLKYFWDWGISSNAISLQAYKLVKNYIPLANQDTFNYNRDVISTRHRVRGRGTSLGLRIESEEGKDLKLLGIGIVFTNRGII